MSAGSGKERQDKMSLEKTSTQLAVRSSAESDSLTTLTAEEERKLGRKIGLRLMPILSLMYLASFLDRSNIGNARLQGLETQLGLTGNKFNIALTMFFIPYCIFECPFNMVLKRFLPSRWLPGITVLWGLVTIAMGFVRTYVENCMYDCSPACRSYQQLVCVRMFLGITEAGLFPGVAYYLTLWYPRHMLQWRIGLFFGAASLAGAFGGALAFGIGFMSGTGGLLGWSWIFILEGLATVIVGMIGFLVLVDFPATAKFLTAEQRAFVMFKKKYDNSSVGEEEHFETRHVVQALTDWQVWLHMLILMAAITNLYGITLFLPTIISAFGHSAAVSQLLTVPPYVVATIVLFIFAYWSDRLKLRSPFILAGFLLSLIGFSINISSASGGIKYFGTFFCVTGSYAAVPGIIAWLGNNLSGQTKRGIGIAFQIGIGHFGGTFASNMYRTQDEPRFIVGHGCELMFVGIGLISVVATVLISHRVNRRRDEEAHTALGKEVYSDDVLRRMGDRAPDFRYTL
ncbi:MFS general substrate transporter [Mycena sanguinolenta]|nr:MFS general substrate transporter [Mycena sanguinolenta]